MWHMWKVGKSTLYYTNNVAAEMDALNLKVYVTWKLDNHVWMCHTNVVVISKSYLHVYSGERLEEWDEIKSYIL